MTALDPSRLQALLHQMIGDMGAAAVAPLVVLGDRLGLYKALAADGPMTSDDLADRTATTERYVREWCLAQAGFGYISYDAASGRFSMSPEQQAVFADADSPTFLTGGYYAIAAMCIDEPKVTHIFKSGEGLSWGEHDNCLFCGTEKFFRPGYRASLVSEWLPALDGVVGKLQAGGKVADVGCGHGASTLVMAEAFPRSEFIGFDFHDASIECANQRAKEAGLKNVRFEVATAKHYPGTGYDLVAYFDCLHDMGDPVGAVAHTRKALKPDGTMLLVEPAASDKVEDNLNPVGRMYYAFSTMICTPASISQEVGLALGAQAGPQQLERVARDGGFSSFRLAAQTPFSMVFEVKA
ncbi:MAG: class I SAM-dependent methyltransferase [Lysobacterales bacterium]|nr:MAG: class I SAM-dependent methyltransferase [Xanthomonadales bacterium]